MSDPANLTAPPDPGAVAARAPGAPATGAARCSPSPSHLLDASRRCVDRARRAFDAGDMDDAIAWNRRALVLVQAFVDRRSL